MAIERDTDPDLSTLAARMRAFGESLGFQRLGITDINLAGHEAHLLAWLERGWQGDMAYMARHGVARSRPAALVPGTLRVISARMDYSPETMDATARRLADTGHGYISRYALGRDYHKLLRARLARLAGLIAHHAVGSGYRVFCDSAPVLEKALAEKAGLGWIGKHTGLIARGQGSWFFLGEIYTDLPLPVDGPAHPHCGTCRACLDACPTRAIVAPYQLDARRCISYLTIERQGAIPEDLRPLIGNRLFGCDDCQMVCPWNRFARLTAERDFAVRHGLDRARLVDLFAWDEGEFLRRTEGMALRRLGHERWLRNIAVALGNAPAGPGARAALHGRADHPSSLVREHVAWALARQGAG